MKPIKQTVCIATEETKNQGYSVPEGFTGKYGYFFTDEELNEYIADIIRQSLENAVKNAYVEFIDLQTEELFDYTDILADDDISANVSKQSIMNAFNQTFKKLKL